jgi:Lrp/AsnC family transcriptional regulator, leucine-responsive regulatory protein
VIAERDDDGAHGPLDPVDRAIVSSLREDGRATLAALAKTSGLSLSAVQARVRKLEARGVIRGYRAVVDPESMGLPITAFVEITPLDQSQEDDAPVRLREVPGIEACYSVAGNANYLLLVRVASPRALEDLLGVIRREASVSTRSTIVLQTYFEGRPVTDRP